VATVEVILRAMEVGRLKAKSRATAKGTLMETARGKAKTKVRAKGKATDRRRA
jgi:hypothetical protein